MKPQILYGLLAATFMINLMSCSPGPERDQTTGEVVAAADAVRPLAGAAAAGEPMPLESPHRRLIHTASMQAEVAKLYEATSGIESSTLQLGGQVSSSTMRKELLETRQEPGGGDSLTELRRYAGVAELSLRVPVSRLDTLLRLIAAHTSFIDTRQVRIDDATFRHLENSLRNKSLSGAADAVTGASRADGLEARQYLDGLRSAVVERQVENLRVDDQAAYASLAIELRQPEELVTRMVPDLKRLMLPGPGARLLGSLRGGWELLYDIVVGLLRVWPLVAVLAAALVFGRRWHRRQSRTGVPRP